MTDRATKTHAIKLFLEAHAPEDLALLYHHDMEVQVNVHTDEVGSEVVGGQTEHGHWFGWTDGIQTWKHFRIPWDSGKFEDTVLNFDLEQHAEAIGMTGWDWVTQQSIYVGYDFDSLVGHVKGLSDAELQGVIDACSRVPWVTVRRSKSGKGLHLYVFLSQPVPTTSRAQHAALARSILGLMVAATGLDLKAQVDKLGGNLWVFHRDTKSNGLSLIKAGEPLEVNRLPANWKDHVEVIEGKRTRCQLPGDVDHDSLDELVGKTKLHRLEPGHRRLLDWFSQRGSSVLWWWDNDRGMLVAHTWDLKVAHQELGLQGLFYTNSPDPKGKHQNCFAFPLRHGGWVVRRHGTGTQEHPAWQRDAGGWTRILYNLPAELPSAAAAHAGTENVKGEFVFDTLLKAMATLKDLGASGLPQVLDNVKSRRSGILKHKDGRLIWNVVRETSDMPMLGWLSNKKGDRWETLVTIQKEAKELDTPDELVRHCVGNRQDQGWYIYSRGQWIAEARANAVSALLASGTQRSDIEQLLGQAVLNHWELVVMPFEDEYPGNRRWNKDSAKLSVAPVEGPHPTWDAVLRHSGFSLNHAVKVDEWCKKAGILNGGDYLKCWVASMVQFPLEPLPYLFFWSYEENTGKSTFHEALNLFIPANQGYKKCDQALTSPGNFNGELQGQVLCIVEETNVRNHQAAHNRMKDWVTSRTISCHIKGMTPFDIPNTTHWIQCANKPDYAPIYPGDTRITMCHVRPLDNEIEKPELMGMLKAEAAAFLYTLKHLELPKAPGRLRVPVLNTSDKLSQEEANQSELEFFIQDLVHVCRGAVTSFESLYDAFMDSLRPERRAFWTKRRFSREAPITWVKGRHGAGGRVCFGNITLDAQLKPQPKQVILVGENLVIE